MNKTSYLIVLLLIITCTTQGAPLTITPLDEQKATITIPFALADGDQLYHDYLDFSLDNPDVQLLSWHTSTEPVATYDPTFKTTKKMHTHSMEVSVIVEGSPEALTHAHLHVSSYKKSNKKITHELYALAPEPASLDMIQTSTSTHSDDTVIPPLQAPLHQEKTNTTSPSWSHYFSTLMTSTDSNVLRIFIAFLLGMLLSLTPCIYPMIPITIGILQAQASKSLARNFSLAFMYTMGIATTFSALGLAAAFTGKMFGSFMSNPFVIITIVALLWYLAGSMLGLYNMYTPRFLQSNNTNTQGGSYVAAFLFGAASGTIASPCLSPGLVLLLTMVSALGSAWLGFMLLFAFGFGLGTPLLIIGTFSGSINMLPRAGMWMIEVKQIFGLLMIATSFYFLTSIFPWYIVTWLATAFLFLSGMFFLYTAQQPVSKKGKQLKQIVGIALIACSVYGIFYAYKETMQQSESPHDHLWLHDFDEAQALAKKEHKPLLIKVSAPYCSLCKAIDKKIFSSDEVKDAVKNAAVAIHIDDIEATEQLCCLKEKFNVMGAPTIILYDPATDTELKRWGGELYDQTPASFSNEINAAVIIP